MNIITLFCNIDDFFLAYEKWQATHCLLETTSQETRGRPRKLHHSEVMTLLIAFHQSGYRTFKHFYQRHVCVYWGAEFPHLVSYSRFVQLKKRSVDTLDGLPFSEPWRLQRCLLRGFHTVAGLR